MNLRDHFQVNEAVHLSLNGVLIPPDESASIMADLMEDLLKKKGRYPSTVESAGVFLQKGCKALIPVVNGQCLSEIEKDFNKAIKATGNRVCQTPRLLLDGERVDFTLGLIAAQGFVAIRVKDHNIPWLAQRYNDLTGEDLPDPDEKGNYFSVSPSNTDGSGDYFHIGFPTLPLDMRDQVSFGYYEIDGKQVEAPIRWDDWASCAKYNSKNFVMRILGMGFRMGKNADNIAAIRENVTNKEAFDAGCAFEVPETCEVEVS